jgi:RNA polymerase sigma-70 factor (ECF subfamily)
MRGTKRRGDEDLDFVTLCQEGNADAFEHLVRRHQKRMLNVAYRIIGNYDEACEVAQDAFVAAYNNIKGFQRKAAFSTWLYAICINLARNRRKRLKSRRYREGRSLDDPIATLEGERAVDPPASEPTPLERLEARDIRHHVQGCINALEVEFKEVLVLRDIQGFSYEEISAMLKVPAGTVKSRLFRAREGVKDCLKKVRGEL